jgi:hypothetical protein
VHGDMLHGLLQFQGENAKFLQEDVVDCVASEWTLEGSEQGALDFLNLCLCDKVSKGWVANGSTQECQRR